MSIKTKVHSIFTKLAQLTNDNDLSVSQIQESQTVHEDVEKLVEIPNNDDVVAPQIQEIQLEHEDLKKLAPLVLKMAQTGEGTDACLELGCLPVLVNYYSPIPDIYDLEKRDIWSKVSEMAGLNFNPEQQIKFLLELGEKFGKECDWPLDKTSDRYQFYLHNNCFNFGCAASLHCMVRNYRPKRVIEIGSGNSSLIISAALTYNHASDPNQTTEYTIVDPYPNEEIINDGLPNITKIKKERVELLDPSFFNQLQENDILFIDSSHSVKIGSDVNYLILQVLPILAPGVVVHFHDITMPHEYPKLYSISPTFRMFWTETYLLQAFLAFNSSFDIELGMCYLTNYHLEDYKKAFPFFDAKIHEAVASSFWIRRKTE